MAKLWHCGRQHQATRHLLYARDKDLYQYEWLLTSECKNRFCRLSLMAYQKIGHDGKLYPATPRKINYCDQSKWVTRLQTDLVASDVTVEEARDTRAIPIVSEATKEISLDPAIGNTAKRVIRRMAS